MGREAELAQLVEFLGSAVDGRGRVALIEGEAGIGKTRLVGALAGQARADGVRVVAGEAEEFDGHRPFGALVDAFGISVSARDPGLAGVARLLVGAEDGGGDTLEPMSGVEYRVGEAILGHVDKLATEAPLVLIVENLHWIDPPSLACLRRVVRTTAGQAILVLLTTRPVEARPELLRLVESDDGVTRRLHLPPMSPDAVAIMAGELLGARPGPRLVRELRRAGGNPLFVTELLAMLDGRGDIQRRESGEADVDERVRSTSLSLTILHRISLLPGATLEVLRLGAVLGASFTATDLSLLSSRPVGDLVLPLQAALTAGVLEEAGDRLSFRHDLIHDSLYEDIPLAVRRGLHREMGLALAARDAPALLVAQHLARGADPGDLEAVGWLHRAGRQVISSSPLVAADLLSKAVALVREGPGRAAVEADLAIALMWSGRNADGEALARDLADRLTDPVLLAWLNLSLSQSLLMRGEAVEAGQVATRARSTGSLDPRREIAAMCTEAISLMYLGDRPGAARQAAGALELGRTIADSVGTCISLVVLSLIECINADLASAEAHAEEAVRLARGTREVEVIVSTPPVTRAVVLLEFDRLDEARDVLLEGRQVTEEFGGRSNVVLYDFALGFTGFFAGTWDDALADIATGMERAEQTLTGWRVDVLSVRAMIESQRGQLKDAESDIAAAQSALGGGEPAYRPEWLFLSRALWREAIGDDAGALDVLRDGWNLADAADLPLFYPLLGHHFARLAVAAGAVPDAEKVARTVRGVADSNPGVDRIKALARWCEAIAEGDPDGLAEAASLVGNTARPLDRALAYEDAAAAMGAADRADEARHLVDQAMVIYEGLGASQRGALAAARLRGCGVRLGRRGGRHRPATGWAALTSTELRVASLVGDGLSNGEIAARMFLSRRTVETHVSHILTKVGCTSKRGLASEAVRRRG